LVPSHGSINHVRNRDVYQFEGFLNGNIFFGQIVELVETLLKRTPATDEVTLEALLQADLCARRQVTEQIV